jgi:tRNA G46 methylase TrmB
MMAIKLSVKTANEIGGSLDASVLLHIASAYIRLGKYDRAREWFERAREALHYSVPERQFDKLQKSESLMLCDFYTSSVTPPSVSISTAELIQRFIVLDRTTQVSAWISLGILKYYKDAEVGSLAASAVKSLTNVIQTAQSSNQAVVVEVCSGSGEWICREAQSSPDKIFIAVEFRFDRCVDTLTRMSFLGLKNLWIICGDAREIMSVLPPSSVSELHINYPEPPPVNNVGVEEEMSSDIVTRKFLQDAKSIIVSPGGKLQIVSDNKLYINTVTNVVNDAFGIEVFPKSSKTFVDSYFARFFSKKAKRYCLIAPL